MTRPALALCAVWALASCAGPDANLPAYDYSPDAGGIALVGSPLRIDFGRTEAGAIAAMSRLAGSDPIDTRSCAGGRARSVTWRDGLSMVFEDRAFLGWATGDGRSAGLTCAP